MRLKAVPLAASWSGNRRSVKSLALVVVLVASGCTNSEPPPASSLDPTSLFAARQDRVVVSQDAGCGSEEAVDIYQQTVAIRRNQLRKSLDNASREETIEVRVSFAKATTWNEVAPADKGVQVTAVGIVLPELLNSDAVQAQQSDDAGDPVQGLIAKLDGRLAMRQGQLDKQQARYQRAVDAENETAIERRGEILETLTRNRDAINETIDEVTEDGPPAAALSLNGSPAALADYLNNLPDRIVHDALVVPAATKAPLIRTRWLSAFASTDDLQGIFGTTAMLPLSTQLKVANAGYGCVFFDEDQVHPNSSDQPTPLAVLESGFGLDAILIGFLRDDGVCLSASFGEGSAESAIVFNGQGNPRYISTTEISFDGRIMKIGDRFKAGGGALVNDGRNDYNPADFGVPDSCQAADNGLYLIDGLLD